ADEVVAPGREREADVRGGITIGDAISVGVARNDGVPQGDRRPIDETATLPGGRVLRDGDVVQIGNTVLIVGDAGATAAALVGADGRVDEGQRAVVVDAAALRGGERAVARDRAAGHGRGRAEVVEDAAADRGDRVVADDGVDHRQDGVLCPIVVDPAAATGGLRDVEDHAAAQHGE